MIPLAVFGSVLIGITLLIFVNKKSHVNSYIIVLSCTGHISEQNAMEFIKNQVAKYVLKVNLHKKATLN